MSESQQTPQQQQYRQHHLQQQQHSPTLCDRFPMSGRISPNNNNNSTIDNNNLTSSPSTFVLSTATAQASALIPPYTNSTHFQNRSTTYPSNGSAISHKHTAEHPRTSATTTSTPKNLQRGSLSSPTKTMSPEDAPTTSPMAGEEGPSSTPNTSSGASSPSNTFNLTCMTCHTHFTSAELYARHDCVNSNSSGGDASESSTTLGHNSSGEPLDLNRSGSIGNDSGINQSESEPMVQENSSDVERFDGKIVYNPDGSAYIFDSEMSEDDAVGLDLHHQEGSIVDSPTHPLPETSVPSIPPIANAFYVTKNTRAFYNALYGQTLSSLIPENKGSEVPIVHSYRVISVGDKDRETECKDNDKADGNKDDSSSSEKSDKSKIPLLDYTQVPIKPILMCFVCKLSFGYVRSFIGHALGDHNVVLSDQEKDLLATKNVSAILQVAGRGKDPRISFLEPVSPPGSNNGPGQANPPPSRAPSGSSPGQQTVKETIQSNQTNQTLPRDLHKSEVSNPSDDDQPEPMETETPSLCVKREMDLFEPTSRSIHHSHPPHLTLPPHLQQFHPNHHNLHLPPPSPPFATPQHPAGMRTPDMSRKSPISALGSNGGRSSLSPVTSMSPTSFSPLPSPITQLTGTIIGACPEHMSGRQQGISCDKCDMILQQSRQLSGQMAFMHSRNSCKTLKCPKCNWHYKYQETLEIHMKEKHPDTESTCIYCLTSQPHPRLARGETYTCGYKPYRCEVCNYSTTTKGNLSIHMQSDKHLNNMQELQNGGIPNMESGVVTPQSQILAQCSLPSPSSSNCAPKVSTPSSTSITPPSHQKPKPMWRCDVCNYETNVARNLRIHMTSEKHTHNMMVLQQNVKHMQQLSALPDPMALLQLSQSGMLHEKPPPPEVAMADLAYNQALLIQMISGGGPMGANISGNPLGGLNPADHMGPHFDLGINPEALEPPPEPVPPNPRAVYTCCVCSNFNTDSLEQLNIHLQFDRSKLNENEVLLIVAGNYICKLCSYKTNLKANFQLHCKTDKHLQKLQYVNHILEGGPRNEWKLKYLANNNPLHVRCNLCEFYTNSVHKLQLHSAHQRHEVLAMLFKHLSSPDHPVPLDRRQFRCCLCNFTTKARLELLHHIRSVRHLQMEQIHQLQRHAEGKGGTHQDIGDIFRVEEEEDLNNSRDDVKPETNLNHFCPVCSYSTSDGEDRLQAHMDLMHPDRRIGSGGGSNKNDFSRELENHSPPERRSIAGRGDLFNDRREKHKESPKDLDGMSCPLCEETCFDMSSLEKHSIDVHSVNSDGLQRLLLLVRLSNAAKKEAAASNNNNNSIFGDGSNSEGAGEEVHHHSNSGRGGNGGGSPSASIGSPMANASRSMVSPGQSSADCDRDVKEEIRHGQDGGGDRERDDRERSVTPAARHGTPTPGRGTPTPRAASTPGVTSPSSAGGETTPTTSTSIGGNLNPQMAEMAAAINALTAAQMQHQMPFNPMMLAGLGLAGLPLHLNPLAAMNLQPPLAPGLPHPMFDPVALANMAASQSNNSQSHQNDFFLKQQQQHIMQHQQQQQQQQQAAAAAAAAAAQQKRGRTRITDEQLKILRAHFDINNSPSEEQITDMAGQSGLPPKVIKHWFRNTLFKERQRCKDSPYNFSIPPSTTLNLEEYEKTGETKVVPLNAEDAREIMEMNRSRDHDDRDQSSERSKVPTPEVTVESHMHQSKVSNANQDSSRLQDKSEDNSSARGNSSGSGGCADSVSENRGINSLQQQHQQLLSQLPHPHLLPQSSPLPQSGVSAPHLVSSASCSPVGSVSSATFPTTFPPMSSPQTSLSLSSLISNQLESNSMIGHKMPQTPPQVPTSGLNHPSAGLSPTPSNLSYPTTPPGNNSSGKRANRTRFTDYQIKVLQEFFENNAYPKDDDLEYLSKLLNLSPRVIVVWFQNARQKARKVYENQPPIDPMEENAGRFTRTPGLNYQCKKCLLVFQRYYELIRHQKTHCFKEEDAKRSAQAQAAAAQAAALYHDDNSSHSSITENSSQSRDMDNSKIMEDTFQCDKCSLVFNRFEQWREHQIVHLMNPALFMNKGNESPFPPLSQLPQHSPQSSTSLPQSTPPPPPPPQQTLSQFQQHQQQHQQQLPSPLLPPASPLKRKAEESEDEQSIGGEQQRDKRLRTTILPEQLDYLYQKYQMEANPSRKMLETIAHEVGLKKRVVQVWFQNTRARERKGQFRAHAQVINKKCPFCPAIFKVKSALESHLSTKHSDQFSSGEINIDALPDLDDHYGFGNFGGLSSSNHCSPPPPPPHPPSMTQAPSLTMPSLFSPSERPEDTLAKYHEEAIRRYLTDVSLANNNNNNINSNNHQTQQDNPNNSQTSHGGGGGLGGGGVRGLGLNGGASAVGGLSGYRREGERPLDLSRPLELARSLGVNFIGANNPAANFDSYSSSATIENKCDSVAAKNAEKMNEKMYGTDSLLSDDEYYQMDVPDGDDNDLGNSYESNPTSPASSTTGSTKQSSNFGTSAKRFRTQMTSTQVKLMKSVFVDYKTPTMAECEMFGREIQLPKRVIQVWFQNARAKEKKAKIALMKIIGQEPEGPKPASDCKVCGFEYNSKYSIQDHLFTRAHIDNMRAHIEKQKEESDQITLANSVSSSSSGINSASNSIPPHALSHPNFISPVNDEINSNYNQFGSQFPPNNLQLHMAHLMALNSQGNHGMNDNQNLKQQCPPLANLGSNPSLNGDIGNSLNRDRSNGLPIACTESSSSSGAEVNMIGMHNDGSAANNNLSLKNSSTRTPLPANSGGNSACEISTSSIGSGHGGKLPHIPDLSIEQSMGNSVAVTTIGGSGAGDDMNRLQLLHQVYQQMGINGNLQGSANNQQQQQHPLLQQPMIEG